MAMVQGTYNGERTVFSINGIGKMGQQDHCLKPYTKSNSKWIKDLNVRPESKLSDIDVFVDMSLKAKEAKESKAQINQWDYVNLKKFCIVKKAIIKTKRQSTEWEIFANCISNQRIKN